MALPTSRADLRDYILRKLGHPVIEINVDDDQVEDRIDETIHYMQEFHFESVQRIYISHQITAADITNRYLPISAEVIGVTRLFPQTSVNPAHSMFDLNYQIRLNDLPSFTSQSYVGYFITQTHLRMLDMMFIGEVPIRFNKHTNRLYPDWDWAVDAIEGQYVIAEGYAIIDPETYTDFYSDRMLLELATAMVKQQWGQNMKKFSGLQLVGGVGLSGQQLYDEATQEITALKQEIRDTYEEPPMFLWG